MPWTTHEEGNDVELAAGTGEPRETSPTIVRRMGGARLGRMRLPGEKKELLELAAIDGSWHPSHPTLGSPEGEAWEGGGESALRSARRNLAARAR